MCLLETARRENPTPMGEAQGFKPIAVVGETHSTDHAELIPHNIQFGQKHVSCNRARTLVAKAKARLGLGHDPYWRLRCGPW